jgi:cold shock CspA family protein
MNGTMLWFNAAKGFGLISAGDEERLPVDLSGFRPGEAPAGRCAGREVVFETVGSSGEQQAVNVRFIPEAASRRARSRHGRRPL